MPTAKFPMSCRERQLRSELLENGGGGQYVTNREDKMKTERYKRRKG
jgi:hypothetical protein